MNTMLNLLVNTGSRTCKLTLCTATGENRQRWLLEGADLPASPRQWLTSLDVPVDLTVHRLVHGGDVLTTPAPWTPELDVALRSFDELAPLHNPQARQWARACAQCWPAAHHILIPDTGFFADLPEVASTLPLPVQLRTRYRLRRHGFHGLAHHSLWQQLHELSPDVAQGRVVTLQLGGGCSAAALLDGKPLDTSMGFTPLAGLVMATRPGDLDPGVLLHLLKSGMTATELEQVLAHESGLRGLSNLSGDMRELMATETSHTRLAIAQFCYRVRQYIGAYAATLDGLDALVFGGGIGEHAPAIRRQICTGLGFLGVTLDDDANANAAGPARLSRTGSRADVWVMPSNEEVEMHRQAQLFLKRA
jgi:acetate kinase